MSFTKKANGQVNSVTEAGGLELNIPDAGATGEPAPKAYENLSKEQLIVLLKERDTALAARAATKKYGLVWEDKEEDADRKGAGMVPLLVADESRFVRADPSQPTHVLIEGDNYHALKVLTCTHERSVDVIYIDPPYNTGNKDFKYNDRFVDKEDGYRHSKWLSFMVRRLQLAKRLLKDTGVIFLSIDESEVAQLKLLCDSVFGEVNGIATAIWSGGRKNDSHFISVSHEYLLCYARSKKTLEEKKRWWREKKQGLKAIYQKADELASCDTPDSLGVFQEASKRLKAWFKSLPESDPSKAHEHYCWIDTNGVYFAGDVSWPGGGGPRYPVYRPDDSDRKYPYKVPARGWGYAEKGMQELLVLKAPAPGAMPTCGIHFGADSSTVPCAKRYLKNTEFQAPYSVIYKDGRAASKTLQAILGRKLFDYPKDTEVLSQILGWTLPADGVVVDFFAGSGSTGHAVMQLNAEDGGTRQCILVTNDEGEFKASEGSVLEGGICTHVTYPRLRRVIEGYTTPAGKAVEGLKENLAFYRAEFTPDRTTHGGMKKLFEELVDTLRFKEGCFDEVQTEDGPWRLFTDNKGHHMVVLLDEFASEECAEIVARLDGTVKVYAFAYFEDDDVSDAFAHLSNVEVVLQPGRLLKALRKVHAPTQKA